MPKPAPQPQPSPEAHLPGDDPAWHDPALPTEPLPKQYRQPWATLLKRTFGIDAILCSKCGARMRLIANIDDPAIIHKILTHLGLPTATVALTPARPPPQLAFDDFLDPPLGDEPVFEVD